MAAATQVKIADLAAAEEREIGTSDWWTIEQRHIDLFADATGDDQWIHVDPDRAKNGPFGTTIAHGYLSLSLLPVLLHQMIEVEDAKMGINYGINKIRFTNPVPSGSRVRLKAKLLGGEEKGNGVIYRVGVEVEIENQDKAALVGEVVYYALA
jgi:acyl dehydratase